MKAVPELLRKTLDTQPPPLEPKRIKIEPPSMETPLDEELRPIKRPVGRLD